jgi:hypothetical protein
MKQRIFSKLGAIVVCLVVMSCSKTTPTPLQPPASPKPVLSLIASDWKQNADGHYVNTFTNVLAYAPHIGLEVYITDVDNSLQISQGGIVYMNGTVSFEVEGTDLVLRYESFDPSPSLPFRQLSIKIIFQ